MSAIDPDGASAPWWRGFPQTAIAVTLVTALSMTLRPWLAPPDVAMLYLAVIMAIAVRYGRRESVVASALSVATYDFFCVRPYYTFAVDDARNLLTFAMMFGIGQVVAGLIQRVRRVEREAQQREEIARVEALRSSLLSAVSHDLRTPLATITGAATALRDGDGFDPARRAELFDTLCHEADRMERLVRNVLDMTRLESGAMTVKRDWVPVEELVGSALGRLDAALHGRDVKVSLATELPMLSVDPVLVEQVLVNLIENATRYTPPGSAIEVSARAMSNSEVEVSVADRGPGVTPGDEERVFEKFFRGADARSGGAGLGLAISRGIAEAHDGSLTVRARDGGGAVFVLTIPSGGVAPSMPIEGEGSP